MQPPFTLGVDIGTSSVKAIVFDARGKKSGAAGSVAYPLRAGAAGAAELDAAEVLSAIVTVCREVVAQHTASGLEPIAAVGLSAFWHGLMALGPHGEPLTPIYTWADTRSHPQAQELKARLDEAAVHQRTGCMLHPIYLPAKMLWLSKRQPDAFQKAARFGSIREYLLLHFFGEALTDFSTPAGGGVLNLRERHWDAEVLDAVGVSTNRLPRIVDPTHRLPPLKKAYSKQIGLDADVPWVVGTGDGACSTIGSGCMAPNRLCLMVGTSAALRMVVPGQPPTIPDGLWCYMVDRDNYLLGGALNNAGILRAWLRETLNLPPDDALEQALREREPDAHGLTFLPFITGERSPGWRSDAMGILEGLVFGTTPVDICQAGLEAVGYRLLEIFERIQAVDPAPKQIVVNGGILGSKAWVQMLADIFGHDLEIVAEKEASTLGAATVAMKAIGVIDDLDAAAIWHSSRDICRASPERHQVYRKAFERHRASYKKHFT